MKWAFALTLIILGLVLLSSGSLAWWPSFGRNHTKVIPTEPPELSKLAVADIDTASTPALVGEYLYVGGEDGKLYKLGLDLHIADSVKLGGELGPPAYNDGYVYVANDNGYIYKVDSATLEEVSSFSTTMSFNPENPPVISDEFLYIGGTKSGDSTLYQLNITDMGLENSYNFGSYDIETSPAVSGDYLYFAEGGTYQFNKTDLTVVNSNSAVGEKSSPTVANGYVYVGSEGGTFYQLNATNVSKTVNTFDDKRGNVIASVPTVVEGYVYFADNGDNFYKLNATNLSLIRGVDADDCGDPTYWPEPEKCQEVSGYPGSYSLPAVTNESVYIRGQGGYLWQFSKSDLSLSDRYNTGLEVSYAMPVIKGDYMYTVGGSIHRLGKSYGGPTPPPTPPDSDNDGIPDSEDNCPNTPGPAKYDGCPKPPEENLIVKPSELEVNITDKCKRRKIILNWTSEEGEPTTVYTIEPREITVEDLPVGITLDAGETKVIRPNFCLPEGRGDITFIANAGWRDVEHVDVTIFKKVKPPLLPPKVVVKRPPWFIAFALFFFAAAVILWK